MGQTGKERGVKLIPVLVTIATVLATMSPTAVRADGMQADIDRAAAMFEEFQADPDPIIPRAVLRNARGLAFITVYQLAPYIRGGFVLSGNGSKGVLVARTALGWSAPSALASATAAYGPEDKAPLAEYILVINSSDAMSTLSSGGNITLGTDVTVAEGPRKTIVGATPPAAIYTYGGSLDPSIRTSVEGAVIAVISDENTLFYGRPVSAQSILSGLVAPPAGAAKLVKLLENH
jgi:lipid-binding SYLF domain-containing protein